MKRYLTYARQAIDRARTTASVQRRFPRAHIDSTVTFRGDTRNLDLADGVVIRGSSVLHLGGMPWCDNQGEITIGADGEISSGCILWGAGPGGLRIGERFDCGPNVCIFASSTDYRRGVGHHIFGPVVIEDDVIVYAGVVIRPGVSIGRGAVLAAGAIITSDVPPHTLVGGVPAAVLRREVREPPLGQGGQA